MFIISSTKRHQHLILCLAIADTDSILIDIL